MTKKTTLKDVAREAGVSVATVSYILNNRTDQKISDATRKKVLQIANLLDYTPNSTAKSLATGRSNSIGLAYRLRDSSPSRNLEVIDFAQMLARRLGRLNYDVRLLPIQPNDSGAMFHRNVDGVIAIDLSHEEFKQLADNCYVPVISVDMLVNDALFYQIYSDLPKLIRQAQNHLGNDFYLILDEYPNQNYFSYITQEIPSSRILVFSRCAPEKLYQLRGQKVLVIGSCLALIISAYVNEADMTVISSDRTEELLPDNIFVIKNDIYKKANVTISILLNALDKKFDVSHDHKI